MRAWIKVALGELGQSELPGDLHNPRILEYGRAVDLNVSDDETPWCSIFVNWCMESVGIQGTRLANARSWLDWGIKLDEPLEGCVVVLKRGDSNWKGHVGFYMDEYQDYIKVLGGNQSNTVMYSYYRKSDVLGYRMPDNSNTKRKQTK